MNAKHLKVPYCLPWVVIAAVVEAVVGCDVVAERNCKSSLYINHDNEYNELTPLLLLPQSHPKRTI